jgi:hypothetical protein
VNGAGEPAGLYLPTPRHQPGQAVGHHLVSDYSLQSLEDEFGGRQPTVLFNNVMPCERSLYPTLQFTETSLNLFRPAKDTELVAGIRFLLIGFDGDLVSKKPSYEAEQVVLPFGIGKFH